VRGWNVTRNAYITFHALERFQEHYPGASWEDFRTYLRYGLVVDREELRVMLRREYAHWYDTFVLSPNRRGCFVVRQSRQGDLSVVTYLRFEPARAEEIAIKWPVAA